jgi:hypothetical protein
MEDLDDDYEPITERLRGVPFDEWTEDDCAEEEKALTERIERNTQCLQTAKFLKALLAPLHDAHPDTPIKQLLHLLPEPERSIAADLCNVSVPLRDLVLSGDRSKVGEVG